MAEKSLKRIRVKGLRVASMQTCVAVPITDPAEIAELEARIKRYEDGERAARIRSSAWASKKITVAELLEQASQLSCTKPSSIGYGIGGPDVSKRTSRIDQAIDRQTRGGRASPTQVRDAGSGRLLPPEKRSLLVRPAQAKIFSTTFP
jgi:hypothetical protein